MDGYPAGSLDHNVPFLIAAGLNLKAAELPLDDELKGQEILLRSELPIVENKEAKVLEEYFDHINNKGLSWTAVSREEPFRWRIKTLGRSLLLPPKKAQLPDSIEPLESTPILHSPFSPLSPVSALYPDGLLDALWVKKHQEMVPSIYTCFYTLTNDPTTTTLFDNKLKTDVSAIRTGLARSGYKTRLAVILLGEQIDGRAPLIDGIQDRLENIRRGSGLDPKSIFFIPPQESPAELRRVSDSILSVLYNTAVDYYRDLGRHARKKRSRGFAPQPTVPPTSGTSQTLSLSDWNFRYDFKAAVFAEFRQEAEPAIRSFEQAYEILLGQDVLDIIPSWSPRWNEARLLADIVAIRCLRLHLWMGQTSLAVRRWQAHRDRIADFADRRGRGTNNYGWQAWEARWATAMANLMERVDIPGLAPSTMNIFLQPEKAVMGERLQPWELLHHTGYWYRIAARHIAARRTLARMMPEEDRQAPDTSHSTNASGKSSYTYDTYLCPAPHEEFPLEGLGVNHSKLIIDSLMNARGQFQARKQFRIAAEVSLECAREMASLGAWSDAVAILRTLWEDMSFKSGWWLDITEEICWLMRRAAAESGNADLVVSVDWELMSNRFNRRPHWHYDLNRSLDGVTAAARPTVSLQDTKVASFISAAFMFRNKESRAGDNCTTQLSLRSDALKGAASVVLASVRVDFEGSLKPIVLEHDPTLEETSSSSAESSTVICPVMLTDEPVQGDDDDDDENPAHIRGRCNLTLKPGQTRVFEMNTPLREPGEVTASSVTLTYRNKAFDLDYTLKFRDTDKTAGWFVQGSAKPCHYRPDGHVLNIQPRPPKMEIKLVEALDQYYANEALKLHITLLNGEEETANVKLHVHISGHTIPAFHVRAGDEERSVEGGEEETRMTGLNLNSIASSSSLDTVLSIGAASSPTTYDVEVRAVYHLQSDTATPITQSISIRLNIVNAFEANYDLVPRLHTDTWPSLFDYEGLQSQSESDNATVQASGLAQRWCLICHYASFATEDLDVLGLDMRVASCVGGASSNVVERPEVPESGIVVAPKTMHEAQFELTAQKPSLDDRQSVTLDLEFIIRWRRRGRDQEVDGSGINTTVMKVGEYLVLGTEPRVLASVHHGAEETGGLVQLDLTIENPSSHFLTFGLTMDPSDTFAFSGAKQTTIHLLPISRRTQSYRLLPLDRGIYVRPGLVVRDKYFQKVLRIIPTEGTKIDKDGLLVWVPGGTDQRSGDEGDEGELEELKKP